VIASAMAKEPQKKLRWDRIIIALVLLGGGAAAVVYLIATR
jgi:hypothetical protein